MASRIPTTVRCPVTGGLTGESAFKWCCFLAEEYLFDYDDPLLYDTFSAMAESLKPADGKAQVASYHSKRLENEIEKWSKR